LHFNQAAGFAERQYRQDSCHPDGQCGIEAGYQRL
jgi:hypothetical protein